jgi:hypothetical protein
MHAVLISYVAKHLHMLGIQSLSYIGRSFLTELIGMLGPHIEAGASGSGLFFAKEGPRPLLGHVTTTAVDILEVLVCNVRTLQGHHFIALYESITSSTSFFVSLG